ncbi:helix-turn-helix domain-containing protein [Nocardiopsis kunsanensis]|uniref:helix-turn-helix domain-containing protein n=1 Tax=Nocardiopsis kunsanensis TaxID=141693 RepID=UPI0027E4508A|nr:helix-turn-helix transcriptional regulator [Nocardiopsis kunsanensis]
MDAATRGQIIRSHRRRRGYSQSVLAGLAGRSESWLSQVERGKLSVDSHEALSRLADILRLPWKSSPEPKSRPHPCATPRPARSSAP